MGSGHSPVHTLMLLIRRNFGFSILLEDTSNQLQVKPAIFRLLDDLLSHSRRDQRVVNQIQQTPQTKNTHAFMTPYDLF